MFRSSHEPSGGTDVPDRTANDRWTGEDHREVFTPRSVDRQFSVRRAVSGEQEKPKDSMYQNTSPYPNTYIDPPGTTLM